MEEYELDYDVQEVRLSEEHVFKVTTVANEALPLEMLLELETRREEISGQRLWEGSLLLCAYLVEACARPGAEKLDLKGKSVLELGAGTGLVSMLAHSLGAAAVVMTDGDDKCTAMAAKNVGENGIPSAQALVTVLRWGDAVSTAAFRGDISAWETLRSQEQTRHGLGRDDLEESTRPVEDRAAILLQADDGGICFANSPTELGHKTPGHREEEEEEEEAPPAGSVLASPQRASPLKFFDFILAGDVLYKHCLLEPFLGTVREMLAPGGLMLLCHVPRAGVTYEIVQEAFGEAGFGFKVLDGGRKAVGGWPGAGEDGGNGGGAATAVGGVEMCEDDARRARLYELRRIATLAS
ncbi:unnamed protein product [Laminaria digitata]